MSSSSILYNDDVASCMRSVQCDDIHMVMVISGMTGSGKSSIMRLLYERLSTESKCLYVSYAQLVMVIKAVSDAMQLTDNDLDLEVIHRVTGLFMDGTVISHRRIPFDMLFVDDADYVMRDNLADIKQCCKRVLSFITNCLCTKIVISVSHPNIWNKSMEYSRSFAVEIAMSSLGMDMDGDDDSYIFKTYDIPRRNVVQKSAYMISELSAADGLRIIATASEISSIVITLDLEQVKTITDRILCDYYSKDNSDNSVTMAKLIAALSSVSTSAMTTGDPNVSAPDSDIWSLVPPRTVPWECLSGEQSLKNDHVYSASGDGYVIRSNILEHSRTFDLKPLHPDTIVKLEQSLFWPLFNGDNIKRLIPDHTVSSGILLSGAGSSAVLCALHYRLIGTPVSCCYVHGTRLLSPYYGETERRIRRLFNWARTHDKTVVFIDELDLLVSHGRDSGHGALDTGGLEHRIVSQFLTEMDGISSISGGVVVVASVSDINSIDAALKRPGRLDMTDEPSSLRKREPPGDDDSLLTFSCLFVIKHRGMDTKSRAVDALNPEDAIIRLINAKVIPSLEVFESSFLYPSSTKPQSTHTVRILGCDLKRNSKARSWFKDGCHLVVDIQVSNKVYTMPDNEYKTKTPNLAFVDRAYGPTLHPSFVNIARLLLETKIVDDKFTREAIQLGQAMNEIEREFLPINTSGNPDTVHVNEHVLSANVSSILSKILPTNCNARVTHQRAYHVSAANTAIVTDPDIVIDRYPQDNDGNTIPNRVMMTVEVKKQLSCIGSGEGSVRAAVRQTLQSCGFTLSDCHWSGSNLLLGHVALGMCIWNEGIILLGVMDGVDTRHDGNETITQHKVFWCLLIYTLLNDVDEVAKLLYCVHQFILQYHDQRHRLFSNFHCIPVDILSHDVHPNITIKHDNKTFEADVDGQSAAIRFPLRWRRDEQYHEVNRIECDHVCRPVSDDHDSTAIIDNKTNVVYKSYDYWCGWCSVHGYDSVKCLRKLLIERDPETCQHHQYRRKPNADVINKILTLRGRPYLGSCLSRELATQDVQLLQYDVYANYCLYYMNKVQLIAKLKILKGHLALLHSHGYVHGDVRMANIMFGTDSDDANDVRLIDFDMCAPVGTLYPPNYSRNGIPERADGAEANNEMQALHDDQAIEKLIERASKMPSFSLLQQDKIDEMIGVISTGTPVKQALGRS